VLLTGIYNTAGINTRALAPDSRADAVHKAMTQIRVAAGVLLEPDAIGMHPNDWQDLRLEKESSGAYLLGPAGMAGDKQVWGMPVVVSTVFTDGTPLVGNFFRGATLWLREALEVTTGLSGTDFTQRRVSILAALRAAFAVGRATAFTTITGF
jgi:HK97 family phage major capsid protein